ncbi:hypothetical protein GCM10009609_05670 [Pseudonocardia aurantiaca]
MLFAPPPPTLPPQPAQAELAIMTTAASSAARMPERFIAILPTCPKTRAQMSAALITRECGNDSPCRAMGRDRMGAIALR